VKGPAPPTNDKDIIDEAVEYFRANILYRTFDSEGPADLTLCYLVVLMSEIIREMAKAKTKTEAAKAVQTISLSTSFSIPGEGGFPLSGFFTNPKTKQEGDLFRSYFRQLREETCSRTLDVIYDAKGQQSKWWFQFQKRKFMNIAKT
jgi:actin related protein 2/3 complex subunit 3